MAHNNTNEPDRNRIRHLLKIGIFAALLVLIGDMLLGWGTADETLSGMEQYFSRYISVSDTRIFLSAIFGMIGIPIECLCYFAIYRLIEPQSPKLAHIYRSGIIGMLIFGGFVHVMCCAVIWHFRSHLIYDAETGYQMQGAVESALSFAAAFLLPASVVLFVFMMILTVTQITAFAGGHTPYPKWCWIFMVLSGIADIVIMRLCGNQPWAYALSTGWISIGNLWTFGGLLCMTDKAQHKAS
ncbi:MAG: hypothetical protein J6I96_01520 [Oscillospiraceae bacterium]|nr:hypothetical protein [Oscillospiraceae bacterium]